MPITDAQLKQIMPNLGAAPRALYLGPLNAAMLAQGIGSVLRVAAWPGMTISAVFVPLFDGLRGRARARLAAPDRVSVAMSFFNPKRLSCGVVVLNPERELLLCHVTGQNHWDLPKGGIDPGETPLQAALRETREEAGLELDPAALLDLGRFRYTNKKDLHLFATSLPRFDIRTLHCQSRYTDRHSGRSLPEMDGYGWFTFERAAQLCTPKMATVLGSRLNLHELLDRLHAPPEREIAAA